jgi:DNA-binding CsgD family transcriptional regulator
VSCDQGDTSQAVALLAEGLALITELGDRRIIALALDGVAGLAIAWRQPERAARLFGAAAALREVTGLPIDPACLAAHDRNVTAGRASLGEDAFDAEWLAGAALPLPVAVAEATAVARAEPDQSGRFGLTPREIEVLKLLAEGLSDREIAESLFLSPRTVGWHVNHLLAKLDVPSRTAAATAAVRRGLV